MKPQGGKNEGWIYRRAPLFSVWRLPDYLLPSRMMYRVFFSDGSNQMMNDQEWTACAGSHKLTSRVVHVKIFYHPPRPEIRYSPNVLGPYHSYKALRTEVGKRKAYRKGLKVWQLQSLK